MLLFRKKLLTHLFTKTVRCSCLCTKLCHVQSRRSAYNLHHSLVQVAS